MPRRRAASLGCARPEAQSLRGVRGRGAGYAGADAGHQCSHTVKEPQMDPLCLEMKLAMLAERWPSARTPEARRRLLQTLIRTLDEHGMGLWTLLAGLLKEHAALTRDCGR